MNTALSSAGQALEDKLRACPYHQKAIGALIESLPSAEGWREVVENASAKRDDELLHKALLVALSKGEQVEASVVKSGAVLITPFEAYVGCAIRASGDVVDALLAAVDCDWGMPLSQSLVLLIAGLYHKKHRNEPPSRRMVAVARKLAREAHGFFSGADALQALARLFDLHEVVEILERQGNTSPDTWLDHVEHLAGSIMEASLLTYLPDEDTRTIATGYTVRRAVKRVGRNDPCPCKSGKKYKKCCYARDQERLKQSSDIAGVTTEELRENAESFLDEQRAWKMSRRELTQLDYARVERTALRVVAQRLLYFREEEALISLFKAVGVTPELEHLWIGALHESALGGSTENLRTLYAIRDPAEVDQNAMSFMVRLSLMDTIDAPVMTQLEQQARTVVESDDDLEAVDLASALLHSRFPALGMVVARGVIPLVDDITDYLLLDKLLAVRDSLALSPVDPIEDVLDLLRPQQTSGVAMSHELQRAQEELGRAGEQVRALRKELANASRRLNEVRTETRSSAAASSTPAANTPPTPDRAGEQALRERIESLKGEIANRNTERARMRTELRAARENLERMQTTKQPPTSSPESEPLVDGESSPVNLPRQSPRLAAYGPRFRSSLDRLPEEIREAGLRLSARLCAGAPAAFRGVSHLAHDRDLLRQRVGIHYRLLFSIGKDQILFHEIVAREALDTAVKRLK